MHLTLHVVGRRMPGWVQQGVDEYVRRLPRHWQFSVREIPQATGGSVDERTVREAENLLAGVPEKARVVALDNRGSAWSTVELAQQLEQWQGANDRSAQDQKCHRIIRCAVARSR